MTGSALVDVNVLIALAWPNHVHHAPARAWFGAHSDEGWATTPVTELGFVRISSNRAAIATASTPEIASRLLQELTSHGRHDFWPDDIACITGEHVDGSLTTSHHHVTDVHLLALARRHGGRLVTFDAAISQLVGHRADSLEVIAT